MPAFTNPERERKRVQFAEARTNGASIADASRAAGISPSTYYAWNRDDAWDRDDGWSRDDAPSRDDATDRNGALTRGHTIAAKEMPRSPRRRQTRATPARRRKGSEHRARGGV